MSLQILNERNNFKIHSVTESGFKEYGRIVQGIDVSTAMAYLAASTAIPEGGIYVASCPELETLPLRQAVAFEVFGAMDIQLGYCNGMATGLDALEYHKSPEFTVADTDVVLSLSHADRLENGRLPRNAIEAFLLPAGLCVELNAGTMHFAPCRTSASGYRSLVALPAGTNLPMAAERPAKTSDQSCLLFSRNKWLVARPDCARLIARGAFPGLEGERLELHF